MASRSNREAAAFFLERSSRVATKVTALSRKEELTPSEMQELADAMSSAQIYGTIGLGHALLALVEELDKNGGVRRPT